MRRWTSLRMIFDPAVVSKFADCGVSMLDTPDRNAGCGAAVPGSQSEQ